MTAWLPFGLSERTLLESKFLERLVSTEQSPAKISPLQESHPPQEGGC